MHQGRLQEASLAGDSTPARLVVWYWGSAILERSAVPSREVLIVGGGAVGLSAACYLARAGARVTLLEADRIGHGSSFGNAGLIVPSFCEPIANPQALRTGLQSLLGRPSPFRIRPRPDPRLLRWLLRFIAACRPARASQGRALLRDLGLESMRLFEELAAGEPGLGLQRRGWLHLYETERALTAGLQEAAGLQQTGVRAQPVNPKQARQLLPGLQGSFAGGIFYPEDAHLDPYRLVLTLSRMAQDAGAQVLSGVRALRLRTEKGRVTAIITQDEAFTAERFVLAAGAWSAQLIPQLPLQPAKGYSLTLPQPPALPERPLMLGEAHVVMTPMGDTLRTTGGLELLGFDPAPGLEWGQRLLAAGARAFPALAAAEPGEVWFGYRPLTPDGLPIIGPLSRLSNLILATGHGQLGITLAPITGMLVAQHILSGQTSLDLTPLLPARFGL